MDLRRHPHFLLIWSIMRELKRYRENEKVAGECSSIQRKKKQPKPKKKAKKESKKPVHINFVGDIIKLLCLLAGCFKLLLVKN